MMAVTKTELSNVALTSEGSRPSNVWNSPSASCLDSSALSAAAIDVAMLALTAGMAWDGIYFPNVARFNPSSASGPGASAVHSTWLPAARSTT